MWFMEIEDVVQAKSRLLLMWKKRGHDPFPSQTDKVLLSLGMLQRDPLLLLRSRILLYWNHVYSSFFQQTEQCFFLLTSPSVNYDLTSIAHAYF